MPSSSCLGRTCPSGQSRRTSVRGALTAQDGRRGCAILFISCCNEDMAWALALSDRSDALGTNPSQARTLSKTVQKGDMYSGSACPYFCLLDNANISNMSKPDDLYLYIRHIRPLVQSTSPCQQEKKRPGQKLCDDTERRKKYRKRCIGLHAYNS